MPVLIGYNSDEGATFGVPASQSAYVQSVKERYASFADKLLAVYPGGDTPAARKTARDLTRDSAFGWHTVTWAGLQQKTGTAKVYLYYFDEHPAYAADSPARDSTRRTPKNCPICSVSSGNTAVRRRRRKTRRCLNFTLFTSDLLQQIIPFVERSCRVYADPAHRAIGGLSMGAFQSVAIGLAHPEPFGSVLTYSGGFGALGPRPPDEPIETQMPWSLLLANASGSKKTPQLLFLGCGQRETGMLAPGQRLVRLLQVRGVNAQWADFPGGHVFSVWRNLLHDSVPLLFRQTAHLKER